MEFDLRELTRTFKELTAIGADTREISEKVMQDVAEKVQADVRAALAPQYMPAGGRFSTGETEKSVVEPHVEWHGGSCEAPVGFDKNKSGAGGFLITGTPKMRPNLRLHEMFEGKTYFRNVMKGISDEMQKYLVEELIKK